MKTKKTNLHLVNYAILNEFIEHISEDIFPDVVYHVQDRRNSIEHENDRVEKEAHISNSLNYFRDRFMDSFGDYYSFPRADVDYLRQRVLVTVSDLEAYLVNSNVANSDAKDLVVTERTLDVFEGDGRRIVTIDSWDKLMALLSMRFDDNEYHCKYYHIKSTFENVAIYWELRKYFLPVGDTRIQFKPEILNTDSSIKQNDCPKKFEDLFYNEEDAEICLNILRELQPPVIDGFNNYIGKAKGIFPLWIKVLKNYKPYPLIKHASDLVYKDILNCKIKGLNLSKDASEFRKSYRRLDINNSELDIKTVVSQYSQCGKLGR